MGIRSSGSDEVALTMKGIILEAIKDFGGV